MCSHSYCRGQAGCAGQVLLSSYRRCDTSPVHLWWFCIICSFPGVTGAAVACCPAPQHGQGSLLGALQRGYQGKAGKTGLNVLPWHLVCLWTQPKVLRLTRTHFLFLLLWEWLSTGRGCGISLLELCLWPLALPEHLGKVTSRGSCRLGPSVNTALGWDCGWLSLSDSPEMVTKKFIE